MKIDAGDMIAECDKALKAGPGARVRFLMKGSVGKRNKRLFCIGGPTGEVVEAMPNGYVYVQFDAKEVKEFLEKQLL